MPLIRKSSTPPIPFPSGESDVLRALTEGQTEERWHAARAAGDVAGGAKALGAALLFERDARIREAILTSLTRMASPDAVEAVLPLMRAESAALRTGAMDALRAMKQAAWPYLPQLLADSDADVRLLACEITRTLPGEEATTLLCSLIERESEVNVCASAIEVLAEVGTPEALPALERCAERFQGQRFLEFSIKVTGHRIRSQTAGPT
ncbi:HEAT repeat domain-containing protein [Paraburkholderia sp. DHOC27]|uniref:HEAT repeat domain-containing protein n=1 Tax=Paraburkholderia sp. DHOC27 TaxID=2303330 RepID=UPI000E3E905C|nr:HEAT repeat domain-containing protein [Paraburkholderia sp. DHOC27]RFU44505.1 HEAT repeat domain-containing protein [Paraburkholderia sp. DHOC27]